MAATDTVALDAIDATTTESINRTVPVRLETSNTKNEHVRTAIADFQAMTSFVADVIPSYDESDWSPKNSQFYRQLRREFPLSECETYSGIMNESRQKVLQAYNSQASRGTSHDIENFGTGNYFRIPGSDITIETNDRGYGIGAKFAKDPGEVWFHIDVHDYQREFLDRIVDDSDSTSVGASEFHLADGDLFCHLSLSWDVEVYETDEIDRCLGVDLNVDPLVASAVVDSDGVVESVEMESGSEYRHHREQIKEQRRQAMENGDLRTVKSARHTYQNYTDHITNVASRRIIDHALEHKPVTIVLEDLTDIRETSDNPQHEWPFAMIQEKIAYKATEEGIPVEFIDPRNTSVTCRQCGKIDPDFRYDRKFHCRSCGYEVHADVNAAINIAQSM